MRTKLITLTVLCLAIAGCITVKRLVWHTDTPEVHVEGPMTSVSLFRPTAKLVALDPIQYPQVRMVIDSPGGRVSAGKRLISAMQHYRLAGGRIVCVVTGRAASMAFYTLMACDQRFLRPDAKVLWHSVWTARRKLTPGTAERLADQLRQVQAPLLRLTFRRFPAFARDRKWWFEHFHAETWHQADDLLTRYPEFGTLLPYPEGTDTKDTTDD